MHGKNRETNQEEEEDGGRGRGRRIGIGRGGRSDRFATDIYLYDKGAFKLILGSSEGRLFYPVTMILNQRLLLAAENIRLEDFYVPSEEKLPPKQKTITVPASQSDSPSRYSV